MRLYDSKTGLPCGEELSKHDQKLIEAVVEWATVEVETRLRVRTALIMTPAGVVRIGPA